MKKTYRATAFLVVLALVLPIAITGCAGTGEESGDLGAAVASSGEARLYEAGEFKVAVLEGDYLEMGRQYGDLLRDDIAGMYDKSVEIVESTSTSLNLGTTLAEVEAFCLSQCELYPKRLRDVMEGLSQTSGLKPEQLALIDQIILWQVEAYYQSENEYCSSIMVWGPYTGGGPLLMGRDFDFPVSFMELNRFLSVIVFNPDDGSLSTAVLSYAGQTGCVQFFNEDGLAAEFNDGSEVTAPNDELHNDRVPFMAMFLQFGLDCSNMLELDACFKTTRFNYPLICNAADAEVGYTYEIGTADVIRRGDVAEGLQVIANTPVDPYWNMPPLTIPDPRRDNLIALADEYKGRIDLDTMKKIMDTPVEDGGSMVLSMDDTGEELDPDDYRNYVTLYQFIYEPATRDLYLKAVDLQDWTRIRLEPLFAAGQD